MVGLENKDYAHFFFDDYDLEAQLIAIRGFLADSRAHEDADTAEIKELADRAKKIGSDHLVGIYTAIRSVFNDTCVVLIIGLWPAFRGT